MKVLKIVVVSLFIYAMVILARRLLNSGLGPGWISLWTLVLASVAAGGTIGIVEIILWLFGGKDDN